MTSARSWAGTIIAGLAVGLGCAACGGSGPAPAHAVTTAPSPVPTDVTNLTKGIRTDAATQGQYLTQVAELDHDLQTYVTANGQVAVQALLTDGEAFCAYLAKGNGIDSALVSVAQGAQSEAAKTHLPSSVTTFNTIDSAALLTLCPSEQTLVPADTRAKIRSLGQTLAAGTASVAPSP